MFVQKYQTGGESLKLPITVILEERAKRGLPKGGLNDPELLEQVRLYESGMSVPQIFGDGAPVQAPYVPLIQAKISRGLSAEQIQNELAGMGMSIPLYQITQLGAQSAPQAPKPQEPTVTDFSQDLASISQTRPSVKPKIGSNQIMIKGQTYELPDNLQGLLNEGYLDGTDIYPILNFVYSGNPNAAIGGNVDATLVNWARGDEPTFGDTGETEAEFRARLGYGDPLGITGMDGLPPEDFGSLAQGSLLGLYDITKGGVYGLGRFLSGVRGGATGRQAFEEKYGESAQSYTMEDLALDRLKQIPGVKLVSTTATEKGGIKDFEQDIEELKTEYIPKDDESVVIAKRIQGEEPTEEEQEKELDETFLAELKVQEPTDPTKVTQEKLESDEIADEIDQFAGAGTTLEYGKDFGPGTDTTLKRAIIGEDGKEKDVEKETIKTITKDTEPRKARVSGLGLARFLSSLGAQSEARNLSELLTKGAGTFAALELAQAEKIRAEESKAERDIAALIKKAQAEALFAGAEPLTAEVVMKLDTKQQELNKVIREYEGGQEAVGFLDQAIGLFEDALRRGEKVTGAGGAYNRFIDQAATFLGFDIDVSDATKIQNFIEIVKQRNIKDILQESGKTISNVDRDILDKIFGKLDLTTPPEEILKKLKASRGNLVSSNEEKQRSLQSGLATLNRKQFKGEGLIGFENSVGLIEKILASDPSKFNETIFGSTPVSKQLSPVYSLSGERIQ